MTKVGIELEFITAIPRSAVETTINNALHGTGHRCRDTMRYMSGSYPANEWQLKTDVSVRGNSDRPHGMELVSPPMEWNDSTRSIVRSVCHKLGAIGATANRSCGLHVHIECGGWTVAEYENVIRRYARYEATIDSVVPPSRRADNAQYAPSIARHDGIMLQRYENIERAAARASTMLGRAKVNPSAFRVRSRETIEFRHAGGTVQDYKVIGWTDWLVQFVEASRDLAQANAATAPAQAPAPVRHRTPRAGSKLAYMVALCSREGGATSTEIESRLGVVDHTVRGYASKLRNDYGYAIETVTVSTAGALAYRIIGRRTENAPAPAPAPAPTVRPIADSGVFHGMNSAAREWFQRRAAQLTPDHSAAREWFQRPVAQLNPDHAAAAE